MHDKIGNFTILSQPADEMQLDTSQTNDRELKIKLQAARFISPSPTNSENMSKLQGVGDSRNHRGHQANSVMIGSGNQSQMDEYHSPTYASRSRLLHNDSSSVLLTANQLLPPNMLNRSIAMDSVGAESISSQLQSIQMQAFKGETSIKGKSVKRMISDCSKLVNKTRNLSKLVD